MTLVELLKKHTKEVTDEEGNVTEVTDHEAAQAEFEEIQQLNEGRVRSDERKKVRAQFGTPAPTPTSVDPSVNVGNDPALLEEIGSLKQTVQELQATQLASKQEQEDNAKREAFRAAALAQNVQSATIDALVSYTQASELEKINLDTLPKEVELPKRKVDPKQPVGTHFYDGFGQ